MFWFNQQFGVVIFLKWRIVNLLLLVTYYTFCFVKENELFGYLYLGDTFTLFPITCLFELTYVCHLDAKKMFSENRLSPNTVVLVEPTIRRHEDLEYLTTLSIASITKPTHTKQCSTVFHYKKVKHITRRKTICKMRRQSF